MHYSKYTHDHILNMIELGHVASVPSKIPNAVVVIDTKTNNTLSLETRNGTNVIAFKSNIKPASYTVNAAKRLMSGQKGLRAIPLKEYYKAKINKMQSELRMLLEVDAVIPY